MFEMLQLLILGLEVWEQIRLLGADLQEIKGILVLRWLLGEHYSFVLLVALLFGFSFL